MHRHDVAHRPGRAPAHATGTSSTEPPLSTRAIPRLVRAAAYAIPLLVLPSAAWRLSYIVDVWLGGPGRCDTRDLAEGIYIAGLSVVSMSMALLTLGLIRPWGEVVPRRIPMVGGRPVPARAATIAAAGAATVIALLTAYYLLNQAFGFVNGPTKPVPAGCGPPGADVLALYAPMLAWAPLLYFVTYQYHRRRTRGDAIARRG